MRAYVYLWAMTFLFFLSGSSADQIATAIACLSSDETWLRFLVSLLLFFMCWMATMLSLWVNPHMDVGQCAYTVISLFSLQSSSFSTVNLPRSAVAFSTFQFIGMSLTAGFGSSAVGFLTSMATGSDSLRLLIHSILWITFSFAAICFIVIGLPQALHTELELFNPKLRPRRESRLGKWFRFLASFLIPPHDDHGKETEESESLLQQPRGPVDSD